MNEAKPDTTVIGTGGLSWSYEKLKKLLLATKGAASYPVVQFLKEYLKGTKLIFVIGEAGCGKTSLMSDITSEKLGVEHSMGSGTKKHEMWPCIIQGQQYIFVDTPGFDSSDIDDDRVFEDIMSCLYAVGPFVNVVGVLFLHDITKPRMSAGEMKTFRWLQCFCGPLFFERITIITTKWDVYTKKRDKEIALGRLQDLKRETFPPVLDPSHGIRAGVLYNNGLLEGNENNWEYPLDCIDEQERRADAARQLIYNRYSGVDKVTELQIRNELDSGRSMRETEAAKVLTSSATKTTLCVLRNKAILMDLDATFEVDSTALICAEGTEPKQDNESPESPMGDFFRGGDFYAWLDLVKQVAGLFMSKRDKVADDATQVWKRIKNWWFGTPPS